MCVGMHTHRPVDVLPDREADTLADWLRRQPVSARRLDAAGVLANCFNRCGSLPGRRRRCRRSRVPRRARRALGT